MVDYNINDLLFFSKTFTLEQSNDDIPDNFSYSSRNYQSNYPTFPINDTPTSSPEQLFELNTFNSHKLNSYYDDIDDDQFIFLNRTPSTIASSTNDLLQCLSSTKESIALPSEDTEQTSGKRRKYNQGRWNRSELRSFVEGLVLYGNEWKKIQTIIKTRSPTQTRSHAQKFFLRLRKKIDLTLSTAEDIRRFIYKYIEEYLHQSFNFKDNFFGIVFSIIFTAEELKGLEKDKKNRQKYFSIQKIYKNKKLLTKDKDKNEEASVRSP